MTRYDIDAALAAAHVKAPTFGIEENVVRILAGFDARFYRPACHIQEH